MGRAGGMDDEALCITDVCQVRPECHGADEVLSRRTTTPAVEGEHRTRASREILRDERPITAAAKTRVGDVRGKRVRLEVACDGRRVLDMALHPQRQRLEPLQEQEGI